MEVVAEDIEPLGPEVGPEAARESVTQCRRETRDGESVVSDREAESAELLFAPVACERDRHLQLKHEEEVSGAQRHSHFQETLQLFDVKREPHALRT